MNKIPISALVNKTKRKRTKKKKSSPLVAEPGLQGSVVLTSDLEVPPCKQRVLLEKEALSDMLLIEDLLLSDGEDDGSLKASSSQVLDPELTEPASVLEEGLVSPDAVSKTARPLSVAEVLAPVAARVKLAISKSYEEELATRTRSSRANFRRRLESRHGPVLSDDPLPLVRMTKPMKKVLLRDSEFLDADLFATFMASFEMVGAKTCKKCLLKDCDDSHLRLCDFGLCKVCHQTSYFVGQHKQICKPKDNFRRQVARGARNANLISASIARSVLEEAGACDAKFEAAQDVIDWSFEVDESVFRTYIKMARQLDYASSIPKFNAEVLSMVQAGIPMRYSSSPSIVMGLSHLSTSAMAGVAHVAFSHPEGRPRFVIGPPNTDLDVGQYYFYHNEVLESEHFEILAECYHLVLAGEFECLYERNLSASVPMPVSSSRFIPFHVNKTLSADLVELGSSCSVDTSFVYDKVALGCLRSQSLSGPMSLQTNMQHIREKKFSYVEFFPEVVVGTALYYSHFVTNARKVWAGRDVSIVSIERQLESASVAGLGVDGAVNVISNVAAQVLGCEKVAATDAMSDTVVIAGKPEFEPRISEALDDSVERASLAVKDLWTSWFGPGLKVEDSEVGSGEGLPLSLPEDLHVSWAESGVLRSYFSVEKNVLRRLPGPSQGDCVFVLPGATIYGGPDLEASLQEGLIRCEWRFFLNHHDGVFEYTKVETLVEQK